MGHNAPCPWYYYLCCCLLPHLQLMLGCDSAGVMCVTAAAHDHRYLDDTNTEYLFPPEVLELDMRGRVEFPVHMPRFAYIDIGEVKMSLGFNKAVEQLGLRLGVLRWLVLQTQSGESDIRLVGRLFSSRSTLKQQGENRAPVDVMDNAADKWGFSLYVHLFDG